MKRQTLLAGDIGGTKTILALYDLVNKGLALRTEATFASSNYPDLTGMVREFLAAQRITATRACFGVAGPVVAGRATITKLPWILAEAELAKALGIPEVKLINDLVAMAISIPHLAPADLHTIRPGRPEAGGPLAVVAPGTGLGEAFLIPDGNHYRARASEGGHTDFAPTTELQAGLLGFLQKRFAHVSYDRACSGRGLPDIYEYLKTIGAAPESPDLAAQLAAADDRAPLIVRAALDPETPCALCCRTLELFAEILAAEAGNLCLKVMATGGLYLGGGIPPRILDFMRPEKFLPPFNQKGRLSHLLEEIPIHVILNPRAALLGAALVSAELT